MKNQVLGFKNFLGLSLLFVISFSTFSPALARQEYPSSTPKIPSSKKIYLPLLTREPGSEPTPTPTPGPTPNPVAGVYYVSPTGNDNRSGTTESEAWATFNRALDTRTPGEHLQPGDTLILLDGIYRQSLDPYLVGGEPGKYLTVRAKNDGKAIIDGEGVRIPVNLEAWKSAEYYDIEGIIARNSSQSVYYINADHNIFRRVSGYNANTNGNEHIFVIWASDTLIEDCVVAGSGRKMILIFASSDATGRNNTIRRCFASYRDQDMREWYDEWPWNENYEAYSADYNTFENDIAYGYYANAGFSLLAQGNGDTNVGNKILGSMAIMGDTDFEGNPIHWGNIRPQPSDNTLIKSINEPCHRTGLYIGHGDTSIIKDNLIQDFLSWGNASLGLCVAQTPQMTNDVLNRVTIYNNGLDMSNYDNSIDARLDDLSGFTITNSRIDVIKPYAPPITGEGARLRYRYVDGVLKDGSDGTPVQPLWPWPMEQRIREELGISVTNLIAGIIPNQVSKIADSNRPFLAASPAIQAFGNVTVGTSVTKPITLKNMGSASLTITAYQFDSNGSNRFSIVSGGTCSQLPFTLTPGQSCTVRVAFSPQDYQDQTTYLSFISSNVAPYPKPARAFISGQGN